MKRSLFISLFLVFLLHQRAAAQVTVIVKASADKQKVLLGEPLKVTVDVQLSGDAAAQFPSVDSFPHFEIVGSPVFDTSIKEGYTFIHGVYQLISFDSGHWVIPPFRLGAVASDSIIVDVVYSDADPSKPYNDIKDVIPVEEKKKGFPWLIFAGGALILAVLLYLLFRKKQPAIKVMVPVVQTDPYQEAMQGLQLWKGRTQDVKAYYSGLVSVFRLYIFRKRNILSLQKTTDDLILQLKAVPLDKELAAQLDQVLRLSDFVKFAKYQPDEKDHASAYDIIHTAIDKTEQLP